MYVYSAYRAQSLTKMTSRLYNGCLNMNNLYSICEKKWDKKCILSLSEEAWETTVYAPPSGKQPPRLNGENFARKIVYAFLLHQLRKKHF